MTSILRKGEIPYPPSGVGDYVDELYTINGFFGDWAHMYRHRNPAHPKSWSDDRLMYNGVDPQHLQPTDATDPAGSPLRLMTGEGITVSLSHRAEAMPFAEKNVDAHQTRFYHRGQFLLETELGPMEVGPGDAVVIPQGLMFRETPHGSENSVLVFETEQPVHLAEELWDQAGFTGLFIDYSAMETPTPQGSQARADTRVRVKYDDEYLFLEYDFDPCSDVIGWLGDPVIWRINVWDVPGIGTTHGFLSPPANAILYGQNHSFFFNVLGPRPFPNVPAPEASYGPPGHLNDYDEVWINHESEFAPDTAGHLWMFPRTVPHPGLKRPPEYPPNPVRTIREMKLNFDTRAKLRWTDEAKKAFLPDPRVAIYTSFYGAHAGVVPEEAARYAKT